MPNGALRCKQTRLTHPTGLNQLVGRISKASYTFVNLNILVHDATFMHPTLAKMLFFHP